MVFTKNACIEDSAFAIIVWYTYRNRSTLKFMALVRTVVVQASTWFIAIVIAQVHIQANFSHLLVRPFAGLLRNVMVC